MRQATLDLLDAGLRRGFKKYNNAPLVDRQKFYKREIYADPNRWAKLNTYFAGQQLVWSEFRYQEIATTNDLDARIASAKPGIYIFFVKAETLVWDFPRIPVYIGIAGDRDAKRPVRERLKDYFRISTVKKRGNVHQMLQLYYPYAWVAYTLLDWTTANLKKLETNLHDCLGVQFATQAYSPDVKAARAAWGN